MFPFWDTVIAPVIAASGAQRIVEIGALRGETTAFMLESLGPDAELHVIDPVPAFDPTEHERKFPGRYVFHRDPSLNVLPHASAFDVALIDGDHNWYTVYNELRQLRAASDREGRPLPVMILHDVAWPYGRRDLYYAPEQIPAEFRQPYTRRGMRPGRKQLLPRGGMNITLDNAELEGGPRNGVMTGLDDFVAEFDRPLRQLVIPIYFGLAILVEECLLEERPALRKVLDDFETEAGKQRLLELSERIRLDATVFEHNVMRIRADELARANDRYLTLLRGALLDQHYLENELRIEYLLARTGQGATAHADHLRTPESFLRKDLQRLQQARTSGEATADDGTTAYFPFTAMGQVKLEQLDAALRTVLDDGVPGDLVECGPGRGGGGVYMRAVLEAKSDTERLVWVADRFRARPDDGSVRPLTEGGVDDLLADLNQVRTAFARFDLFDERVRFLEGAFSETLLDTPPGPIALLRIGAGADIAAALEWLYDRVSPGGYVIVENTARPGAGDALDGFRRARGLDDTFERVGWSGIAWRKREGERAEVASTAAARAHRPPLAPPLPADALDLSVVVVFFNMRREAARTLHSLSRAYQRGIDDLRYEVIVVENGSAEPERLGAEFVAGFGPEFRYLDLGPDATPSPTGALNKAIALGRGCAFALMIDGAHVLSPGVLKFGVAGLRTYEPAVVATQQWYVGPGQQPVVVEQGYDQAVEDDLFAQIEWPADGYRLFEISHFIGDRDWFDGVFESNCLFVPRSLLEQIGAYDESFSMPGGGYANLDLWERMTASPDATMVSILGEGSFHQVHGGTTTNDDAPVDRRSKIYGYGQHYEELRGRLMRGAAKPMHYVGTLSVDATRRTRARHMTATAFAAARWRRGADGVPEAPERMPEDLRTALIDSFWRGLSWQQTTWLGHPIAASPTDLVVYQELLAQLRPDWIVATGNDGGGRALFLASICELLGRGQVISVSDDRTARREHPRVTYVALPPHEERTAERVREITGDAPNAFVILGSSNGAPRIVQEFTRFAPLVPVGSYVVVENTIVNGHPVWPGYGPGPTEAVRRVLALNGDFVQDTSCEKHGLTFNPGGFLRRTH